MRPPCWSAARRNAAIAVAAVVALAASISARADAAWGNFHDPHPVRILGYSGDAMEPFISRDGRYLLFNNLNDAATNTDLYWAERLDDDTFRYRGPIRGANSAALDGVASMSRNSILYFISPRSYNATASTVYRGHFSAGAATSVQLVSGLSAPTPLRVIFDAEVSADGASLWLTDSTYGFLAPLTADLALARRAGTGFARDPASARLLLAINTPALEYAPDVSADQRELFFTRLDGATPSLYRSQRASATAPFPLARRIAAITGFSEGPSISPDGRSLYFHHKVGATYQIWRVSRTHSS